MFSLDASHSPCLSAPRELAQMIAAVSAGSDASSPAALPSTHHYVGPLNWEPPSTEDSSFLAETGAPWALVSLSPVPMGGEMAIARAALNALADRPVRTLLTLAPGYPGDELGHLPSNATVAGFVPHGRVLGDAALLVSHAGHGIVMKGLYFGVPMLLVPWARDQFGVAARAEALGVAAVVRREHCSDDAVEAALDRIFTDQRFRERAARVSGRLRASDPGTVACLQIETFLGLI
jgi:MGT family glycosyltransferase